MQFCKETKEHALAEKAYVEHQISSLQPFSIQLKNNKHLVIQFDLHLTLVDGKILCFFTDTSSMQVCPLCHAKPSEFNNLELIGSEKFSVVGSGLTFGASPLHAWIRFLECCLHIAYRMSFKKW